MYLVSSPDHFHHKKTAKQITTNKLPTTTSIENKNANNNNEHKNRATCNKRQKKIRKDAYQRNNYIRMISGS